MAECMSPESWLSIIKKEYLQDFIREGGAAVKCVVTVDGSAPLEIKSGLQRQAEETGFFFTTIDAAFIKIHLVEQIFYQVAKQVDWDAAVLSFLRCLLQDHYKLPQSQTEFTLEQIALLNGYEERDIRHAINNRLRDALFLDYAMSQEFRIAMITLCRHQLDSAEVSDSLCLSIKGWLRGELRLVSALKQALIFQKIGRHNARNMLLSLAHWLKLSGKNGLVLLLDISRYTMDKPKAPDGTFYYSTGAVLDCYEVLRQFIDGTDESEYCFLAILAQSRFLDEGDRRSVHAYDALKLRIWDEVHDRIYINPLAPLVRISCCQSTGVK
ncbi:MAG: DUF2791 family P-loop domain-containing protein [Candidatus Tectomicrobia bacterium]|uniref:DUF2791 family P-loop domain-containing protein n=1 Tax=Tectimicrobiota bacterium TaxID=2528274 RepID=A0A933GNA3_UNCTE|nr:DUF2791 family P-loop domain-containing protein [Candidatus Tectomicrobia bacterium]